QQGPERLGLKAVHGAIRVRLLSGTHQQPEQDAPGVLPSPWPSPRGRGNSSATMVAVLRREDARLLRGGGQYVGDLQAPGLLTAAILRSPHAHARIRSVDLDAARALPGVALALAG